MEVKDEPDLKRVKICGDNTENHTSISPVPPHIHDEPHIIDITLSEAKIESEANEIFEFGVKSENETRNLDMTGKIESASSKISDNAESAPLEVPELSAPKLPHYIKYAPGEASEFTTPKVSESIKVSSVQIPESVTPKVPQNTESTTESITPKVPQNTESTTESITPKVPQNTESTTESITPKVPQNTESTMESVTPKVFRNTESTTESITPKVSQNTEFSAVDIPESITPKVFENTVSTPAEVPEITIPKPPEKIESTQFKAPQSISPKDQPIAKSSLLSPTKKLSQISKDNVSLKKPTSFQSLNYLKTEASRVSTSVGNNNTPSNIQQTGLRPKFDNNFQESVKPHNPFIPAVSTSPGFNALQTEIHDKNVPSKLSKESIANIKTEAGLSTSTKLNHNAPATEKAGSDEPAETQARLVICNTKCSVFLELIHELRTEMNDIITETTIDEISSLESQTFDTLHLCLAFKDSSDDELGKFRSFFQSESPILKSSKNICLHFDFGELGHWNGVSETFKTSYSEMLEALKKAYAEKVIQCSFFKKYSPNTEPSSKTSELELVKKDIKDDMSYWPNLQVLDYGMNHITSISDITFPASLRSLTLGGAFSLQSLSGIKIPSQIKNLNVSYNAITSIEYMGFPQSLQNIDVSNNKIYFLHSVDFPQHLQHLDVSRNRIDNLKSVNFPKYLVFLSIANNPIECIKGVRFPESIEYLDASCIPNESMTGIKFPDQTRSLNLQSSMTNTRGLKLPPFVENLNLACNGVNSINPLKLPNSIQRLFLTHNNIKTLNKVVFPLSIRELYLGNNMITTLKNVQFPPTLEVLDLEMDPHNDDNEKFITSLKDVFFPMNLRVLRLGYHSIKSIESIEFPYSLEELSLQYNDLRVFRNINFGPNLRMVDLSGNQDLMSLENVYFPESLRDLKLPSIILNNLPASIVERANKGEIKISKSMPYMI